MAVSKAKKKSATKPKKEESKAKAEESVQKNKEVAEVKPEPVKPEPVKPEPVKPEPVKPEPVKPKPKNTQKVIKELVLKHKIGDIVSFQGKEWRVLVVVNKNKRERLRVEREGARKAIWLEDLD